MSGKPNNMAVDPAEYWREEGGQRWVANIDHVDQMIGGLGQRLVEAAAPMAGERVLDVGCGGGTTSVAVAERVAPNGSVLGIDVSKVILDVARERHGNVNGVDFELGDAASTRFEPHAFDLIVSRFGVMFFEHPSVAFKNLRGALAEDGRLVFICWRALKDNPWMARPAAAAFEILPAPEPPDPKAPGPFSFADPDWVNDLLTGSGFRDVVMKPVDVSLNLGPVDGALRFLTQMGAAATALREASDADAQTAIAAVERTLRECETPEGVLMESATWLVSASAG